MPSLILASTSPFRRQLLEAAGLSFTCEAPGVEEHAPEGIRPRSLARRLAREKARAVAARHPDALVIGSDQTVDFDGALLRKPQSRRDARSQLGQLSGATHRLHTAVALRHGGRAWERTEVESITLAMRALSRRELDAYLDTNEWQGCAGGYRIEGQGIKLFDSVRGDYHAIVGLPMLRLLRLLREARFPLF